MRLQRRLGAVGGFFPEAAVANLERLGAAVRAVGEQLLGRRRALGMRQVDADADPLGQRDAATDRSGISVEAAIEGVGFATELGELGLDAAVFDAARGFGLERAEVEGLQSEDTELVGLVLGDESFVADDVEVADQELHAAGTLPHPALGLGQLQPALHALVEEGGVDLVGVGQLLVLVVGEAVAAAEFLEQAVAEVDVEARIDPGLLDVQVNQFAIAGGQVVARRRAVDAVVVADREAAVAAVVDERQAAGIVVGLGGGVGQRAADIGQRHRRRVAERQRLGAGLARQQVAADVEVVGLDVAAVGMEHDLRSQRHVDDGPDVALVRGRAVVGEHVDVDRLVGHGAGNAGIDDVDDAADRRRAVEQRRRAAQHLDPLGELRIDDDSMVDRGVRHVEAADAVGQHPDALALETAQHRAGGVGAEGGRADAGLPRQGLTDGGADLAGQLDALQDGGAGQDIGAVAHQRAGDDDVGGLRRVDIAQLGRCRSGDRRGGGIRGHRRRAGQRRRCQKQLANHIFPSRPERGTL